MGGGGDVDLDDRDYDYDHNDEGSADRRRTTRQPTIHDVAIAPVQSVDDAPRIQHRAIRLKEEDRTRALRFLLDERRRGQCVDGNSAAEGGEDDDDDGDEWDRVLIFVATRHAAERVSGKLRRHGIKASELHGKLDQSERDSRLGSFRDWTCRKVRERDIVRNRRDGIAL